MSHNPAACHNSLLPWEGNGAKLKPEPQREDGQGNPENEEGFYLIVSH